MIKNDNVNSYLVNHEFQFREVYRVCQGLWPPYPGMAQAIFF